MGLLSAIGRFGRGAGRQLEKAWPTRGGQNIQAQLNDVEDAIMALPEHERPVADMIFREQGAGAAARYVRSILGY